MPFYISATKISPAGFSLDCGARVTGRRVSGCSHCALMPVEAGSNMPCFPTLSKYCSCRMMDIYNGCTHLDVCQHEEALDQRLHLGRRGRQHLCASSRWKRLSGWQCKEQAGRQAPRQNNANSQRTSIHKSARTREQGNTLLRRDSQIKQPGAHKLGTACLGGFSRLAGLERRLQRRRHLAAYRRKERAITGLGGKQSACRSDTGCNPVGLTGSLGAFSLT